ncbi:lycopene cyclase domain-containing protein [Chloroflexota bacterium]
MTYFGFLGLFVAVPLLILAILNWRVRHQPFPHRLSAFQPFGVVLAHVVVALLYTTPWDNYLVATGVWWYEPVLVTGLTLGWIPIEEYTFFILQTLLTGFWLIWLARKVVPTLGEFHPQKHLRWWSTLILALFWLISVGILLFGWHPGTYLALILIWALPPIMVQTAFGADILWGYRSLVLPGFIIPTLYLSLADTLAIRSGTWTIDPAQSTGILFPGSLPVEEFLFFLVTNLLISFGITLVLARESQQRVSPHLLDRIMKVTRLQKPERTQL